MLQPEQKSEENTYKTTDKQEPKSQFPKLKPEEQSALRRGAVSSLSVPQFKLKSDAEKASNKVINQSLYGRADDAPLADSMIFQNRKNLMANNLPDFRIRQSHQNLRRSINSMRSANASVIDTSKAKSAFNGEYADSVFAKPRPTKLNIKSRYKISSALDASEKAKDFVDLS